MIQRREFITLLGGAAAWPLAARAQQGMPVIGYLHLLSPEASATPVAAFRKGLSEAGYVEGRNVTIEYRFAHNDNARLPELAAHLVRCRVAVIVTPGSTDAALAAKAATTTIPIVFSVGDDPVKLGLVTSLSRPGGNATGVNFFTTALGEKRLGLLHELVPRSPLIAVLVNPTNSNAEPMAKDLVVAAHALGKEIKVLHAGTSREIDAAFSAMAQTGPDALLMTPDPLFSSRYVQLITQTARRGIPAFFASRSFVEAGGLMSYGTIQAETYRQVGVYTGRILKGEKPADLPVVQSTKFELVINLQTARVLGLEIPATLLARADEVIE